jgi:hypothetical protein
MIDTTHFPFPLSGAALIEEARAARCVTRQEEQVRAHVRAILPRLESHQPSSSQAPSPRPGHRPKNKRAGVA